MSEFQIPLLRNSVCVASPQKLLSAFSHFVAFEGGRLRLSLLGNVRGLGAKSNSISEWEEGREEPHLFVEDRLESELVDGAGADVDGVLEGEGGVVLREEVADGRVVPPHDYRVRADLCA